MNLQKRIFRTNMGMLILSLIVMLAVSLYVVESRYLEQLGQGTTSQRISRIQTSLETFEGDDFTALGEELYQVGGQLAVFQAGNVQYTTMDKDDLEELEDIAATEEISLYRFDEEFIVTRAITVNEIRYTLYAFVEEDDDAGEVQLLLGRLLVVGGLVLLFLLVLNQYFTRRMLKHVLAPLHHLQDAMERINQGDYETPIQYKGDQEFEVLTQGFNTMQGNLLVTKQTNARYERNRTQMVADISHDLRTPLTSIKGYAKGLLDGVATHPEKQHQYVTVIYQKTQVMESLLETLLAFSKMDTDQIPFCMEKTDLGQLLRQYIISKEAELALQDVCFDLQLENSLPVLLDKVQFRRVLDNLVENAQKYAGVSPLMLSLSARPEQDCALLTFRDNGQGLPIDELDRIFRPFYRVDRARQLDSHGLGLAIVSHIVQRHGGTIKACHQDGLCFEICLPLEKEIE